ncbi:MAG TPA: WD40 repeat domain-containing protein, partial [Kouleothrix sp.]|nr:WD40 repeat domain-containing protein [Kouleothrix sp.]
GGGGGVLGVVLAVYAFGQRGLAEANAARADAKAQEAQANADTAATAQAIAQREAVRANQSADVSRDLTLSYAAQAELSRGNPDQALQLALLAADKPSPLPFAERTLADAIGSATTLNVYPRPGGPAKGHKGIVNTVAFSPDGTMAVSGGRDDHLVIVWDLATGKELQRLAGHTLDIRQAVFLPDGKRVLSGSTDGTIMLWDVATGKRLRTYVSSTGELKEVKGLALRPNSNQFMVASAESTLQLWDIDCAGAGTDTCTTPARVYEGHTQEVNNVAFTSDGKRAVSASQDGSLILWDVDSAQPLKRFEPKDGRNEQRGVAILPDDSGVVAGGESGVLARWDFSCAAPSPTLCDQPAQLYKGHTKLVYDITVTPDGKQMLSSSADNTIILWDIKSGSIASQLRGHGGYIREVGLNPQNPKQIISCSADGTLRLWSLNNHVEGPVLKGPGQLLDVAFSPDNQFVLGGTADSSNGAHAVLWDARTGKQLFDQSYQTRGSKAVAFSPDGKYILAGGDKHDGTLALADARTGSLVRILRSDTITETFGVNAVAFLPDSKRAIVGSLIPVDLDLKANPALTNTMLMLWDVENSTLIRQFLGLTDSVNVLQVVPDGKQVLVASGAGISLWNIDTGARVRDFAPAHASTVNALALSADGTRAVSGSKDGTLVLWDVASGQPLWQSPKQSSEVAAVALSHDGRYAAAAVDVNVFIWDLQQQQPVRQFSRHTRPVRKVAFSADDRSVISAASDSTVRFWRFDRAPDLVAWARQSLYVPQLTCDQLKQYGMEQQSCQ